MIESRAVVVVSGESGTWVESHRQQGCSGCDHAATGCGVATLSSLFGQRSLRMRVENPLQAAVGSEVTVAVAERGMLVAAARLYLTPLVGGFLLLLLMEWLLPEVVEWLRVGIGLLLTLMGVVWLRHRGWFDRSDLTPTITRIHRSEVPFRGLSC